MKRPKLAIYWGASCGGCEVSILNLYENILALDESFELFFCPCLTDRKHKDVQKLQDKEIFVTLFNGAIGNSENKDMACLLRAKSEFLIAFGSCASEGCVSAIKNLINSETLNTALYKQDVPSWNPHGLTPAVKTRLGAIELSLPELYDKVKALNDVAQVDYYIPGCPPEPPMIMDALNCLKECQNNTDVLPTKGSVLCKGTKAVCEECSRKKSEKKINRFYRLYEIEPNTEQCLLEQGIVCMGIATRNGCGALCPRVNMPCTGCFGPPEGVLDQGARMTGALAAIVDIGELKGLSASELNNKIDEILSKLPDPAGTFYKYSLAGSILKGCQ